MRSVFLANIFFKEDESILEISCSINLKIRLTDIFVASMDYMEFSKRIFFYVDQMHYNLRW